MHIKALYPSWILLLGVHGLVCHIYSVYIYLFTCLVIHFSTNSVKTVVSITTGKVSDCLIQVHVSINSVKFVISTLNEKDFGEVQF